MNKKRALIRPLIVTAVAVVIGLVAAHASSRKLAGPPVQAPSCAKAASTVAVPRELRAKFPLPRGTVLTSSERSASGILFVQGVIPKEFRNAVDYFVKELPAAGFLLGAGDAEQGEAESAFSGQGVVGKWRVNGILNCSSAVTLALAVQPG